MLAVQPLQFLIQDHLVHLYNTTYTIRDIYLSEDATWLQALIRCCVRAGCLTKGVRRAKFPQLFLHAGLGSPVVRNIAVHVPAQTLYLHRRI